MPIARKHQIAAKLETSEGVDPWGASTAPAAGDVLAVFEPAVGGGVSFNERRIAGASLSRGFDSPARETRQNTFRSDLVGNTTGATDDQRADALPPWDSLLRACGFQQVKGLKCTGTIAGPFYGGERVGSSAWSGGEPAAWGIAVNAATVGGTLWVIPIKGDLTAATTLHGEQSGSQVTTATVAEAGGGRAYRPDSLKTISVDLTGAWSGTAPSAGDVVLIKRGGEQRGSALVVVGGDPITLAVWYGGVQAGDTLETDAGSTATVDGAPTVLSGPSVAIYSNLDGLERRTLGARGDFSLAGESGQILEFSWTFSGGAVAARDTPQIEGVSLSPLQGPRFQGAYIGIGYDREGDGTGYFDTPLPLKGVDFAAGISTEDHRNPTAASGIDAANVTDRDPRLSFDVDMVGVVGFDWFGLQANGTPVRFAIVLGSTPGNRVAVIVPNGQVVEVTDGEADGLATHSVTVAARRIREAGDDEVMFFKF